MARVRRASDKEVKKIEEKAEYILTNYAYFENLDLAGWKWEFIRRTDEYVKTYQKIKKVLADAAPKDDIELVGVLHSRVIRVLETFLTRRFNIKIDYYLLRKHSFPYADIEKEIMNNFLLIPNPALKYTELGNSVSQFEIVRGAVLDKEKVSSWGKGNADEFGDYCIEFLTEVLPPVNFRGTLYIGISLATTRTEAVRAVDDLISKHNFLEDSKKDMNQWGYNLIAYDLAKDNHKPKEIAGILNEAFPGKFSDIRTIYNCITRGKKLVGGEYRKYLFSEG